MVAVLECPPHPSESTWWSTGRRWSSRCRGITQAAEEGAASPWWRRSFLGTSSSIGRRTQVLMEGEKCRSSRKHHSKCSNLDSNDEEKKERKEELVVVIQMLVVAMAFFWSPGRWKCKFIAPTTVTAKPETEMTRKGKKWSWWSVLLMVIVMLSTSRNGERVMVVLIWRDDGDGEKQRWRWWWL